MLAGGHAVLLEDVGATAGCPDTAMCDVGVNDERLAGLDVGLVPGSEQVMRGEPCCRDMHRGRLQDIESDGLAAA